MSGESFFERPAEDCSLAELQVAAACGAQLRDEAVAAGDHASAARFQAWTLLLTEHRDTRRRLERAAEDALAPESVDITDLLRLEEDGDTAS